MFLTGTDDQEVCRFVRCLRFQQNSSKLSLHAHAADSLARLRLAPLTVSHRM